MRLFTSITLMLLVPSICGALTVDLADATYPKRVSIGIEYVVDVEHSFPTFETLTFSTLEKGKGLNIGHRANSTLLRFYLTNSSEQSQDILIEIAYGLLDYVNFYAIDTNTEQIIKHVTTGDMFLFKQREIKHKNLLYPLTLKPGDEFKIFIHVKSEGTILIPLNIWKSKPLLEHDRILQFGFGIYYGIMVAMILYNLFLAISLRDKTFFVYVCYIISFTTMMMTLNGYAHELIFGNYPFISNIACPISIGSAFGFLSLFAILYLKSSEHFRIFHYVLVGLMTTSFSVAVASAFLPYTIMVKIASILAFLIPIAIFTGLIRILRVFPPAKYFVLALAPMLTGVFIYSTKDWGILPMNFFTTYAIQIGSAMEVMLLSLGLANKINYYRREKEEAQRQAIENLQKSDKIKDEFLAKTSHELRTPLTGIVGITESLAEKAGSDQKEDLAIVLNNARRLSHLVNDLLEEVALKEGEISLKLQPVELRREIDSALHLFVYNAMQKRIELINNVDITIGNVLVDIDRFDQILHNLINNAIKYTKTGCVTVSATQEESMVRVSIADTGIGINDDDKDRIFKAFQQVRSETGTGLGLSITKQLVELHGGIIGVESIPGEGTVFHFTVPTTNEKAVEKTDIAYTINSLDNPEMEKLSLMDLNRNDNFTILAVDDELINLRVLENHLAEYNLTTASSGIEALEIIERKKPDLVLLDVMMPDLDGFEVCKKIREKHSRNELPVIFVTAKNQVKDLKKGFQVGGNDYLPKPFSKGELIARIEHQFISVIAMQLHTDFEKIKKKENLSAYYYIQQHLPKIDHIICKKPNIEIYGNGISPKSFEIPLREIGLFFAEKDLMQVRINSYVNPNNVQRVQKTSRTSFEIVTSQGNRLPIGKTFLDKVKTQFPDLFEHGSSIH